MKRTIAVVSAVSATVLLLALWATPASANTAQGYVGGSGAFGDDWGDEGTLSQSNHAVSGATGLWQLVLWADGAIESNGTPFDSSDVDCHFGPNTTAATRSWQTTHKVGVDGQVGPQTFGAADGNLQKFSQSDDDYGLYYVGKVHRFYLDRFGGAYWFIAPDSGSEQAEVKATYSAPPGQHNDCWA